ncbi:MAG: hypothetical protein M3Y91_18180 [Actinomycetota bacterium]|nr:hypothetical protein [Actinomycetota bacterium]
MSRFWPAGEAAQADYERLREAVLATGRPPDDVTSARFARKGLAGLIAWPASEPVFASVITGAARPPWTPYGDPRTQAAAAVYGLLVEWSDTARRRAGSPGVPAVAEVAER